MSTPKNVLIEVNLNDQQIRYMPKYDTKGKLVNKPKCKKAKKIKTKSKNMFLPISNRSIKPGITGFARILPKVSSTRNLLSNTLKTSSSCNSLGRKQSPADSQCK